eukprot:6684495-Prorocentrum_lima.AAC.1
MTSSLVGSEMCIRDSSSAAALGGMPCDPYTPVTLPWIPLVANERPPEACLLYTSDAADDM